MQKWHLMHYCKADLWSIIGGSLSIFKPLLVIGHLYISSLSCVSCSLLDQFSMLALKSLCRWSNYFVVTEHSSVGLFEISPDGISEIDLFQVFDRADSQKQTELYQSDWLKNGERIACLRTDESKLELHTPWTTERA
jgi:hypothetical protein